MPDWTKETFVKAVRDKYPDYKDWSDDSLLTGVLEKYPEYRTQISNLKEMPLPISYKIPKEDNFSNKFKEAWKESTKRLKDINALTFKEITPVLPIFGLKPQLQGSDDALINAFEPILEVLEPKLEEPTGKRLGKEATLLGVMPLILLGSAVDDPVKTIKGVGEFFLNTFNDWMQAVRSPLDPLYDPLKTFKAQQEIKRTPLFHTIPILGLGGLFKTKIGKLTPKAAEQLSTKLAKDVVKEAQKRPELRKPFPPDITETSKLRAEQAIQRTEGERLSTVPEDFRTRELSNAQEVQKMFNRGRKESAEKYKFKLRSYLNKGVRAFVDVSGNIKRGLIKEGGAEGRKAVMEHDLVRGGGARASLMMKEVDNKIYKGLNKSDRLMLDDLIASRREIEIGEYKEGFKHPEGLTMGQFTDYIESFRTTNPKKYEQINKLADDYFKVQEQQFEQLNNAGLLTEQTYNTLKNKDYSPRKVLDYIDPDIIYTHEGRRITVTSSGLKRLEEGSFKLIETDSRMLLSQVVSRTQTRIARNQANQTLYKLATENPNNGIVEVMKGEKIPAGKDMISVMIDGKRNDMLLPREMAKEWVETDPIIQQGWAETMSWVSGAKVLRPMATGINPEFAIANFPRDIMHIYLTALDVGGKSVYSPHLPIFGGQMVMDLKVTAKDAFTRKGRFNDYIMEGGGMEFLTHQGGGGTSKVGGGELGRVGEYLGYLGETSEIWTRLALRERSLKRGKSPQEATWIARNYLDFAQGGNVAKAFDTAVPYLNAGIQGARGIFRSAKNNPSEFMMKASWIGATASSLWMANRFVNPETWEAIPDHVKAQNWIITTPHSYKDKDGNKRYVYYTVAKDQGQRVMATGFEMLMSKAFDNKVSEDQLKMAMGDFLPYEPTASIPPTFSALAGVMLNKDFYTREDIWKGYNVIDPSEEYYADTHPAWKSLSKIGKSPTAGISPERTKYAVSQFLTRRNIYTDAVGGAYKLITEGLPEKDKDKANEEILKNFPFIRKGFKVTPLYLRDKGIEETKIKESTASFKRNRTLDDLVQKHLEGKISKDEVIKFTRSFKDKNIQKSLVNRFKQHIAREGIPNMSWWKQVGKLSPEARAEEFHKRYETLNREEQDKLKAQAGKIPSFVSDRFKKRLNQLSKIKK